MAEAIAARMADLQGKLKARTDRDGKPRKNYETNVAAIKAEIDRLERKLAHGNSATQD